MSTTNGFRYAVISNDNLGRCKEGPYTGPTISRHHDERLAERAARRQAHAVHGQGQTFWVVKLSDAYYHWGFESRCTGAYETRCAVCVAVLEALPDYSDQYEKCSCGEPMDPEQARDYGMCGACLTDKINEAYYRSENWQGLGAMCAECDGPLYPDNVGKLCGQCASLNTEDRRARDEGLAEALAALATV